MGLLGASWEPPGSLLGAWAAARGLRRPKIAYLHVFTRFQGAREIVAPGSVRVIVTGFGPGGNLQEGGKLATRMLEY